MPEAQDRPSVAAMPAAVFPVLYAEDNRVDADLTRSHFARTAPEFSLEIVHRAEDFLAQARKRRHAVLLLDQRLPDLDGVDVLKILAQEGIDTPLVLVTGVGDGELASQVLRLGADDYVPKRIGYLDALPQRLRDVIERRRRQPAALRQSRLKPRRVLLVEADPHDAAHLIEGLGTAAPHIAIEIAASTGSALDRLLADADIDLVISDHRPPAIDGFALIAEARRRGRRTPVIMVAPAGTEEMVVAAFGAGASDFVLQPEHHFAELALRIDVAVDRHELTLANERAAAELAERQRTLGALRESDRQLNLALEAGRIGLWSWIIGSDVMQFSSRWKAQVGYTDEEIADSAKELELRCHPDDLAILRETLDRYLASPWPDYTAEYRLRHKDGSWRWFMLHAAFEADEEGRPYRMVGTQIEITALKQHQAELTAASIRLQQLSRRLLDVQERERRHLARELHDEIGQVLTVAKIHLQSAALGPQTSLVAEKIKEPLALLDRLLAQVRSLSLDLRPPLLDDLGLVPALHWLLQHQHVGRGMPGVHLFTDPALKRFDATLETACYRIAQEALTNALRHSRAKNINITLTANEQHLRLVVEDDGVGFDPAAARDRAERGGSLGVLGMHERASLVGGSLSLLSAPGRGTMIDAVFPLSNPSLSG